MRRHSFAARLALAVALGAPASPALACPVCDSENGKQVRAGVFNDEFGWNLLKVTSPFPLLLGAVGLAYCLMPAPRDGASGGADGSD